MAATPLVSATSLASGLGIAVKNAAVMLDGFCAAGLAVEVTYRSKRRLFGLVGLAPLRAAAPPYRPLPGRGRGRPSHRPAAVEAPQPPPPLPAMSLAPTERRRFDCSELDRAMALVDETIRATRRRL